MVTIMPTFASTPVVWAAFGLFLLVCEFFVPGIFLMFFGIGALVAALLSWIIPVMPVACQWIVFAVVSLASLLMLRKRMKKVFAGRTTVSQDKLDDDFTDRRATAVTPLEPGAVGKVELHGAEWAATADEPIPANAQVVVVSRDGLQLKVRKA